MIMRLDEENIISYVQSFKKQQIRQTRPDQKLKIVEYHLKILANYY